MSAHNKPHLLPATLDSIYRQKVPFPFEVIVVDDGSADNQIRDVCLRYPVRYHRIEREPVFRNPAAARNVAYRMARGEVLICQSDEVVHVTEDAIERLVCELLPGTFLLANVFCLNRSGSAVACYTGPTRQKPFFFLGSLFRRDMYSIGGNDEEFTIPACEDSWLGECLTYGARLVPRYITSVVGHHQWHEYVSRPEFEEPSRVVYRRKHVAATRGVIPWQAAAGPWPFYQETDMETEAIFTAIYRKRAFFDAQSGGVPESASGAGSSREATAAIRRELPRLCNQYGVKTFFDLCCGDCNWITHVNLGVDNYIGADVVRELVDENRRRYGRPGCEFMHLDLLTADLPTADLVLCRDVLVHYSFEHALQALRNIARSGSKYLLTTTFAEHGPNRDVNSHQEHDQIPSPGVTPRVPWTPYNLQMAPFNLPIPLESIDEQCREHYPAFADKRLGLWRIEDIRRRLEC